VLAGGKDLDCLGTGPSREFQQAGVQALVEEQVRGQNSQHGEGLSRLGWVWRTNRTVPRLSHFETVSGETGFARDCGRGNLSRRDQLQAEAIPAEARRRTIILDGGNGCGGLAENLFMNSRAAPASELRVSIAGRAHAAGIIAVLKHE